MLPSTTTSKPTVIPALTALTILHWIMSYVPTGHTQDLDGTVAKDGTVDDRMQHARAIYDALVREKATSDRFWDEKRLCFFSDIMKDYDGKVWDIPTRTLDPDFLAFVVPKASEMGLTKALEMVNYYPSK